MVEDNSSFIKPIRLIVHVGAGKTGTSSIQKTLEKNVNVLKNHGIEYLGLMLEKAEHKLYDWQNASRIEDFHLLSLEKTEIELLNVLRPTIESARKNKIHTLIWSNESFFTRYDKLCNTLKVLEREGVNIELIAYVRRHDSWARSAYVQWGLKHKTNYGELLNFASWIKRRKPSFYPTLHDILNIFPNQLTIRNMDTMKDVVKDFLTLCNLDNIELKVVRANESPKNEELFLRTLFNSQFEEQKLPVEFDKIISSDLNFAQTPNTYLQALLPTEKDLENINKDVEFDRESLNKLLHKQGQEGITESKLTFNDMHIDSEKLIYILSEIVIKQAKRLDKIEKML